MTQTVEILLLPRTTLILASNLIEPLRAANRLLGEAFFDWRLSSLDGAAVRTTSGVELAVHGAFEPAGLDAPLLLASSYGGAALCTPALRRQLLAAARRRPLVGAADGGVVLLAEAGLLKGRRAAFHSEDVETLSPTYADVDLSAARWVIDRDRATARGAAPALELMLALVARWHGKSLAQGVAKLFDYPLGEVVEETGQQRPQPLRDDLVSAAVRVMNEHLQDPLSIAQLASVLGQVERTLHARFCRELGLSPQRCYVQLRLNRARQLLLETDWPLAEVASRCGYGSGASFSRAFRARYGYPPSQVRGDAPAA